MYAEHKIAARAIVKQVSASIGVIGIQWCGTSPALQMFVFSLSRSPTKAKVFAFDDDEVDEFISAGLLIHIRIISESPWFSRFEMNVRSASHVIRSRAQFQASRIIPPAHFPIPSMFTEKLSKVRCRTPWRVGVFVVHTQSPLGTCLFIHLLALGACIVDRLISYLFNCVWLPMARICDRANTNDRWEKENAERLFV